MPSHITLRYNSKIKPFRWPNELSPEDFLRLVANTFGIKGPKIIGFKNKNGNIYDLNYLLENPVEAQKESYMLVLEGEKPRPQSPKPKEQFIPSVQASEKKVTEELSRSTNLSTPMVVISNFTEFEKSYLRNNENNISILFVIEKRDQLKEIGAQYNNVIKQFTGRFDFFCYLRKDTYDNAIEFLVESTPAIALFCGTKKFLEVPFDSNEKSLVNVLSKLQPPSPDSAVLSEVGDTPAADDFLAVLEACSELTDKEYYFLKAGLLEQQSAVVSIFQKYARTKDRGELLRDISRLSNNASTRRLASRESDTSPINRPPILHQNFVRPETSEARSRKSKEISSTQERFIQITAELERKGLLTEHSASLIKSLILEENSEVINTMNSYVNDAFNEKTLSSKLVKLAEKLSPYIVRPTSPLPKKDELIKLVNTLVRRRLKDDNDLLLLNKLILEGDELVYSTFEVFEADRDEEDLLDTLIRIVHKYKKLGKFDGNNLYATTFYSAHKIPLVENDQELFKERKENHRKEERPISRGGSYFDRNSRSRSAKKVVEKVSEKSVERIPEPKERPAPQVQPQTVQPVSQPVTQLDKNQLIEKLKELPQVRRLPPDEYGILFWMVKNEFDLISDVIKDAGGPEHLDKALPDMQFLANKKLGNAIKEKFTEGQRVFIAENKCIKNSATYAAFQCFKYDQDLPGLISSLQEVVSTLQRVPTPRHQTVSESENSEMNLPTETSKPVEGIDYPRKTTGDIQPAAPMYEETRPKSKTMYEELKNGITPEKRVAADPNRSPSKFTPLLNRSQRADSFKGSFQLKLISSDHPEHQTPMRDSIIRRESTPVHEESPNENEVQINVIIPPKNENNQFTQGIIDRFFENQEDQKKSLETLMKVLSVCTWLTKEDRKKLQYLFENYFYELYEVLFEYETSEDLEELEKRLKEDILPVDVDNISVSPRAGKRMIAYHSFKSLLHSLKKDKLISERQYKMFHYLYIEEDVTVLACYEVYQTTKDIKDFLDTMFLIEQIQYFKTDIEHLNSISHLNDVIEYQLKVIYSLKKYLNLETRVTLEKIIRAGDETVMHIYQDYKKSKNDAKNKSQLIHKLVSFAAEKTNIVRDYEKKLYDLRHEGDKINIRRREIIENFYYGKLLPEVRFIDILYEMAEQDDVLIHSLFEIYEFNKDKQDFVENLNLVYKYMYRVKDAQVLASVEVFHLTKDANDFFETVAIILKQKKKRRASNELKVYTKK